MIDYATVTTRGRITIPVAARKKFGIKGGDKVLFGVKRGRVITIEKIRK